MAIFIYSGFDLPERALMPQSEQNYGEKNQLCCNSIQQSNIFARTDESKVIEQSNASSETNRNRHLM